MLWAISPIKIVDVTFSFTSDRSGSKLNPLSLPRRSGRQVALRTQRFVHRVEVGCLDRLHRQRVDFAHEFAAMRPRLISGER